MTQRFQPIKTIVDDLKERAKAQTGFDFVDVRWDGVKVDPETGDEYPGRGCLCVYEKNRAGRETIRKELRDPPANPERRLEVEVEYEEGVVLEDGEPVIMSVPLPEDHPDFERDILGLPRQITSEDVKEVIDHIYGASRRAEGWQKRLDDQREAQKAEQLRVREDYVGEAAKEIARAIQGEKSGKNPFVDLGSSTTEKVGDITITDNRRVK